MSDVTVRPFAPGDEAGVGALWEEVFGDHRPWNAPAAIVRRKTEGGDGLFWVAEREGRVVGAVMAGYDGQRGWIYHLAVDAMLRRHGIGRALVEAAERELAARGCPKVNLQVLVSNREVVGFWEGLGWTAEERVSMGKTLAPARPSTSVTSALTSAPTSSRSRSITKARARPSRRPKSPA